MVLAPPSPRSGVVAHETRVSVHPRTGLPLAAFSLKPAAEVQYSQPLMESYPDETSWDGVEDVTWLESILFDTAMDKDYGSLTFPEHG